MSVCLLEVGVGGLQEIPRVPGMSMHRIYPEANDMASPVGGEKKPGEKERDCRLAEENFLCGRKFFRACLSIGDCRPACLTHRPHTLKAGLFKRIPVLVHCHACGRWHHLRSPARVRLPPPPAASPSLPPPPPWHRCTQRCVFQGSVQAHRKQQKCHQFQALKFVSPFFFI